MTCFDRANVNGLSRGAALRAWRLSRLSLAGALLAGTAMAPAQTVEDLGGGSVTITMPANFAGVTAYTNGTVTLNPASMFNFGNPLIFTPIFDDSAGPLTVTKTGVNAVLLATPGSSHSGNTSLNGGLVVAGAENVLSPNSRLVVGGSGRLELNGFSQTVAGLQGATPAGPDRGFIANNSPNAVTLTVVGNATTILNSRVTESDGVISIVLNGTGVQGFNNADSNFSGGVTLNSGTLRYGLAGSLGSGTVTVAGAGTSISPLATGAVLGNAVQLNEIVAYSGSAASTWTGVVSGSGGIAFGGTASQLTLANAGNSFSGGITMANGRLYAGADNAFGTGDFVVNATGVSGAQGDVSVTLGNNFVLNTQLNLDLPTLGNVFRIDGDISGASGLFVRNQSGDGELQLFGDNSFANGVLVTRGSVGLGSDTALGTGLLRFGPEALGVRALVDGLEIANGIQSRTNPGEAHFIDTQGFTLTLNGNLGDINVDPGRFEKIGNGTLVLNGNVTTTGGLGVNAGTVVLNGATTNSVDVQAGATLTGAGTVGGDLLVLGGTIVPGTSPGTLVVAGDLVLNPASLLEIELQTPGVVGMGVNDLIQVGGNLTLDGTANFQILPGFTLGTFTFITYDGTLTDNGLLVTSSLPGIIDFTLVDPSTTPGEVQVTATFAASSLFWDGDGVGNGGNGIVDGGSGIWNDVSQNWTLSDGSVNLAWIDGVVAQFGGTAGGTVTVVDPKTVAGINFTTDGYVLEGDQINLASAPTLVSVDTGLTAIVNNVLAGADGLDKDGGGELVLGGANTFAGGLNVLQGAVTLGTDTAAGSDVITLGGGTTLRAGADGLVVANAVALSGPATVDTNGATAFTLDGVVSGTGPLNVINSPGADLGTTLILNGVNTYSGGTVVTGTTVQIAADTALGAASGALTLDEGQLRTTADITTSRDISLLGGFGQIDVAGSTVLTANGMVGGLGELSKVGTGTLVLGNAGNDFEGDLVIRDGTVQVGSASALGLGNIRFEDLGGTLALTAGITTGKTVQLLADGTIDTIAGDSTFTGVISGPASLSKDGPAQLTLTGVNTYAGGTFLNQGALRISNDDAIGTGTLTTQDGTTLTVGIANDAVITLANDIVFDTGTTTINFVGNLGLVNATTGATLTNGTRLTLNGTISGDGGFISQNFGTVTLNGNNSYAGGTELFGVAAFVGSDTALGTGLVTLNDFASVQNNSGGALSLANALQINATPGFGAVLGGSSDLTLGGAINGGGVLDKAGTNVLTVTSDASGFAGVLNVNNGDFRLGMGAVFGDAALETNVRTGATLSGVGTITGTVNMADFAILSPGNSPGTLTVNGDLNLSGNTILAWELGQPFAIGGALNDRVVVTGNLVLDGLLSVTEPAGGSFGLGVYNLFSYGTLTDNGVTILPLPGGFNGFIQNNVNASQVNLIVAGPGVLVQQWDGPDQLGNGIIDGGDGVWSLANFNWTGEAPSQLNSTWQQNSIGVFQGAAGTVQVVDDFQFTGLSFLTSGYTLTAGGGSLQIGTQSFIHTDTDVTTAIAAPITGAGQLLKQGSGILALNGANSYAGGTALQEGVLQVGSNSALGTGALTMANFTTLAAGVTDLALANAISTAGIGTVDSGPGVFTLSGTIGGPGSIRKVSLGNLVLNGANSFDGLDITAGLVTLGTNTAGGSGVITIQSQAALAAGVDGLVVANNIVTPGVGVIWANGRTFTLNGSISGPGSINLTTPGNLVLNGNNSFTGLGISEGRVTLGSNTAAGIGGIILNDGPGTGATLAAGVNNLVLANNVRVNQVGLIDTDRAAWTTTLNGTIFGPGSIRKVSLGNLVLNGANSFDGLDITAGLVTLGTNTAGGSGVISIQSQAALAAGVDGLVVANNIVTPGVGVIWANGRTFTLNGSISGPGSINLTTPGNLVLNGNNSFTGLGISEGRVTLGSNTAAGIGGIILNDGPGTGATLAAGVNGLAIGNAVRVNQVGVIDTGAFTFTLNGPVMGPGAISKVGSGNLVLNGANSFNGLSLTAGTTTLGTNTAAGTGPITIGNATLASGVSGLTIANAISLTGAGIINSGTGTLALSGVISGTGSLNKQGTGILTLSGTNSYTGGTIISAGTLTITNASALGTGDVTFAGGNLASTGGTFTLANNAVFNTAGGIDTAGGTLTMSGVLSGAGQLQKLGTGTLILTGANSYAGGTLVSGGTLQGNSASFGTGPITNNANLVFNQGTNGTFGQAISGTGTVTKTGTAQLILSGTSTYTGATTVAQGALKVNGSIGSSTVTVQTGAVLQGTGTVGGIIAQSGARIQPGNSVGTLTVNGPVTFQAGSFYDVDVTPGGADRITATGALTLAGTMAVAPTGTFTNFNQTFTVASGSTRTGTFNTVTGLGGFGVAFNPLVEYTANSVLIRLAPASLVGLAGSNVRPNGLEVARAFDRAVAGGFNPQAFLPLFNLGTNVGPALEQFTGEIHSAQRRVAMEDSRVVRETALDRLNATPSSRAGTQSASMSSGAGEVTYWLRAAGSWGTAGQDARGTRFTTEQIGFLTGLDYAQDGFKVGAGFTYTQNDIEMTALGNGRVRSTGGVVYAGYRDASGFALGLGGAVAGIRASANRGITVPGLGQGLRSTTDGQTYQLFGELSYNVAAGDKATVAPFARYAYVNTRGNAFGETGGVAAISAARQSFDISVIQAGARGTVDVGGNASLTGSLAYQNISGDRAPLINLGIQGLGQLMPIATTALDRDSVAVEARVNVGIGSRASVGLGYSGVIGNRNNDHGARATLTIGF